MYTTREQDLVYQNEVKEIKLLSLLEITNAINENAPVEHLMKIFSFILKEQLGFSKFVLLMYQKSWKHPVKVGYKGKINLKTVDKEFSRFKEITIIANKFNLIGPSSFNDHVCPVTCINRTSLIDIVSEICSDLTAMTEPVERHTTVEKDDIIGIHLIDIQ